MTGEPNAPPPESSTPQRDSLEILIGRLQSDSEHHARHLDRHDQDIGAVRKSQEESQGLMRGLAETVNKIANSLTSKMADDQRYRKVREDYDAGMRETLDIVVAQNTVRAETERGQAAALTARQHEIDEALVAAARRTSEHEHAITRWQKGIAGGLMVVLSLVGLLLIHSVPTAYQTAAWWAFVAGIAVEVLLVITVAVRGG